jgi:hypothetical protein
MYYEIVHIKIMVYQTSNVKKVLNTILNNQFQIYL